MYFVVAGAGYTGQRVLSLLPGEAIRLGRPMVDLDAPPPTLPLPEPYTLLYTVPPKSGIDGDRRLQFFLALIEHPPTKIVYLSTTGVYGDRNGESVFEDDPPAPSTRRATNRLAAERLLGDWCHEQNVDLIILRLPGIYGPGRLGLDRIRSGVPIINEAEANPGNRIHVDDLAHCCARTMIEDIPPGVFNIGDGDHRSGSWFTKTVAKIANLDLPPEISREEAENTFSEARLSFLAESRTVDTSKMREILGFTPRYGNAEDGIRASLQN